MIKKILLTLEENGLIDSDFECVYLYIVEILTIKYAVIFLVMIIGLFLKVPLECIGVICSFKMVREYVGGIHANNKRSCLIASAILIIMFSLLASHMSISMSIFIIVFFVCSFIMIIMGPINCTCKKSINKQQCKIKILKSVLKVLVISFIFRTCKFFSLSNGMLSGITLCTAVTIVGFIVKGGREKKYANYT